MINKKAGFRINGKLQTICGLKSNIQSPTLADFLSGEESYM